MKMITWQLGVALATGICRPYSPRKWENVEWEELGQQGEEFKRVAGNSESNAVWAIPDKRHLNGDGYAISYYDNLNDEWKIDKTQPKGSTYEISVDSHGMPAFIQYLEPRSI